MRIILHRILISLDDYFSKLLMIIPSKSNCLSVCKSIGTIGTATAEYTIAPRNVLAGRVQKKEPSGLINVRGLVQAHRVT